MGKPTGFLDYERKDAGAEAPLERIRHFNEFHTPLSKAEQEKQGARCMACGVPFCQAGQMLGGMMSGCPLQNMVPEWNDLLYLGNWEEAYYRLMKTSNFPEFTGRVCPGLCEAACTCNLNGDPVGRRATSWPSLRTPTAWDMPMQGRRRCVQAKRWRSSAPVPRAWLRRTS